MTGDFWATDFWASDFWADGFWADGVIPPPPPPPPSGTSAGGGGRSIQSSRHSAKEWRELQQAVDQIFRDLDAEAIPAVVSAEPSVLPVAETPIPSEALLFRRLAPFLPAIRHAPREPVVTAASLTQLAAALRVQTFFRELRAEEARQETARQQQLVATAIAEAEHAAQQQAETDRLACEEEESHLLLFLMLDEADFHDEDLT